MSKTPSGLRPTTLGKKNWLFVGQAEAGKRSAILYTVVECCRRRGLDPFAYLRDILTRLPSATNWQIDQLTPEAWTRQANPGQIARAALSTTPVIETIELQIRSL